MATSFDKIIKLMLMEMQDNTISKMDLDIAHDLLSDLIITGATVDFNDCEKDLYLNAEYQSVENIIAMDVDKVSISINRKDYILDNVLLKINDITIEEFSYEFTDTEVIITYPFKQGDEVMIVEYFIGEFYEDLNSREKYIVALAANCHYLNQKILKEDNLRIHLGDKDYKMSSSWSTLKQLVELKQIMDKKLEAYIDKYKYDSISVEDLM